MLKLSLLLSASLLLCATAAQARNVVHTGTLQGQNRSISTNTNISTDPANKSFSSTGSITGSGGHSVTTVRNGEISNGSYNANGIVTGANGQTSTYDRTVTPTGDGSYQGSVTRTGDNGTSTTTRDYSQPYYGFRNRIANRQGVNE